MNETLKRALSGAVYIILLLGCISYSQESLSILFGVFLLIGVYEFSKMAGLQLFVCLPIAAASYYYFWNKSQYIIPKSILVISSIIISTNTKNQVLKFY